MNDRPDAPSGEPADSDWRPVASPHVEDKPPLPQAVKYGGLAALAVLIVGAVLVGIGLGGGFLGSPSAGQSATPPFTMEPPIQLGSYVRGTLKPSEDGHLTSADYSDGTASIVVVLQWPQTDLDSFMGDAGFETPKPVTSTSPLATPVDDLLCGLSDEYSDEETVGCATIESDTGLMVVGLSNQDEEEIRGLLDQFEQSVTG